jgi:hypothetical protein
MRILPNQVKFLPTSNYNAELNIVACVQFRTQHMDTGQWAGQTHRFFIVLAGGTRS